MTPYYVLAKHLNFDIKMLYSSKIYDYQNQLLNQVCNFSDNNSFYLYLNSCLPFRRIRNALIQSDTVDTLLLKKNKIPEPWRNKYLFLMTGALGVFDSKCWVWHNDEIFFCNFLLVFAKIN